MRGLRIYAKEKTCKISFLQLRANMLKNEFFTTDSALLQEEIVNTYRNRVKSRVSYTSYIARNFLYLRIDFYTVLFRNSGNCSRKDEDDDCLKQVLIGSSPVVTNPSILLKLIILHEINNVLVLMLIC